MTIGFIGLGTMGRPMALNLLRCRHEMVVYARKKISLDPLLSAGAQQADTPADLAARCELVFTMVTAANDVEEVLLGSNGVINGARPGTIVVDTSTIDPTTARTVGDALRSADIALLDAPVSGGPKGAQDATLSFMVGGELDVLERIRPVLDCLGTKVTYMGPQGAGQITKACHQLLLLVTAQGVAESLTLARRAGLNPEQVRQAMMEGVASSRVLELFGERMARREFTAGIESRLYHKDLDIVLRLAHKLGIALPAGALTMQFVNGLHGQGLGSSDLSALILLLEKIGIADDMN